MPTVVNPNKQGIMPNKKFVQNTNGHYDWGPQNERIHFGVEEEQRRTCLIKTTLLVLIRQGCSFLGRGTPLIRKFTHN